MFLLWNKGDNGRSNRQYFHDSEMTFAKLTGITSKLERKRREKDETLLGPEASQDTGFEQDKIPDRAR